MGRNNHNTEATPANNFGWPIMLLPYIEQKPLYDRFDFDRSWQHANNTPLNNQSFPLLFCPSHTVEFASGSTVAWTLHYQGVAGAKGARNSPPAPTAGTYAHIGNTTTSQGGFSLSGTLCNNRHFRPRDIVDGLSNTLVIGEMAWDPSKMGYTNHHRQWAYGSQGADGGNSAYCIKNVLNPINGIGYDTALSAFYSDISFGSQHAGGAQFALGDGKVTFISENVDMDTYKGLASRDDRETVRVP